MVGKPPLIGKVRFARYPGVAAMSAPSLRSASPEAARLPVQRQAVCIRGLLKELGWQHFQSPCAATGLLAWSHFADGVDQGLRLVKLDVFRAIVGEDLFSIGR